MVVQWKLPVFLSVFTVEKYDFNSMCHEIRNFLLFMKSDVVEESAIRCARRANPETSFAKVAFMMGPRSCGCGGAPPSHIRHHLTRGASLPESFQSPLTPQCHQFFRPIS